MSDPTPATIRLLIVDDHPVVRDGLRGMFAGEAEFEVVGEAADGAEAVTRAERMRPDVILMDLRVRARLRPGGQRGNAARRTRVTVRMDYGVDLLDIRVTDEGRRDAPGDGPVDQRRRAERPTSCGGSIRPGRGILGMRERCELLGGELDARPIPGGGFEVTARLPLAPTGTAQA